MATGPVSRNEERLLATFRDLDRHHNEFTLTISGFMRGGKRQLVMEPKPRIYLEERIPLSVAVDD